MRGGVSKFVWHTAVVSTRVDTVKRVKITRSAIEAEGAD